MTRKNLVLLGVAVIVAGATGIVVAEQETAATFAVTTTAIEACSCPLFCSCYYNTEPSGGHHCEFNNAYRFDEGSHWGDVDLSGAKVWVSGDLGSHYGEGKTEWAVVSFDTVTTPEQRAAIHGWIGTVFPVQWGKVEVREDDIAWENGPETADASLGSGMASIHLDKVFDPHGNQAVVMNTPYWASGSNDGFHLAHGTHHFDGTPSYSYEKRNGFTVSFTVEGDVPEEGAG